MQARHVKALLLSLEAVLCSAPCFLAACGGVPMLAVAVYRATPGDLPSAAKSLTLAVGITWALTQYVDLAVRTIDGRRYRFGPAFWLGVVSAALSLGWTLVSFEWRLSAPLTWPIALATVHFIALQRRRYGASSASAGSI